MTELTDNGPIGIDQTVGDSSIEKNSADMCLSPEELYENSSNGSVHISIIPASQSITSIVINSRRPGTGHNIKEGDTEVSYEDRKKRTLIWITGPNAPWDGGLVGKCADADFTITAVAVSAALEADKDHALSTWAAGDPLVCHAEIRFHGLDIWLKLCQRHNLAPANEEYFIKAPVGGASSGET